MTLLKSRKDRNREIGRYSFRKYAYLPVWLTDGSIIWLEHYNHSYEIISGTYGYIRIFQMRGRTK